MCHVLIIEDEVLVAELLQCVLEEQGAMSFDFAATQEAAVEAALAHHPDLITSDAKLVSGTGPQAFAQIHDRLGDVPVIFVTGTPEDCAPCNPPGRVLRKPLDEGEFVRAYHELALR